MLVVHQSSGVMYPGDWHLKGLAVLWCPFCMTASFVLQPPGVDGDPRSWHIERFSAAWCFSCMVVSLVLQPLGTGRDPEGQHLKNLLATRCPSQ